MIRPRATSPKPAFSATKIILTRTIFISQELPPGASMASMRASINGRPGTAKSGRERQNKDCLFPELDAKVHRS
jgi:hypothetical protein